MDHSARLRPGQALWARRQAVALAMGAVLARCANPLALKDYLPEDGAELRREVSVMRTQPSVRERAVVLASFPE